MKRLIYIVGVFLLCGAHASAQTRTYSDLRSSAFVIGLESYYFGDAGSLAFSLSGRSFQATVSEGSVSVGGTTLRSGLPRGGTLVGLHDFTDDGVAELVIALRSEGFVQAFVYEYNQGRWTLLGSAGARSAGVSEIRVFRQALTIKDKGSGALHTWTCHDGRFDFKSSSGLTDPDQLL